jgi:hypothetical protein
MKYRYAILCVVLVFFVVEGFAQQQDFPRGVYLSGNTKVNYFQLRDSLHLTWVQASGDSIAANPVLHRYVESNPAGLNVISARAEVSPMYELTRSQSLRVQAEDGVPLSENDYTYAYFKRLLTPKTGAVIPSDGWIAQFGTHQAGYMASGVVPDSEYHHNRSHYWATFNMKIDTAGPSTTPIALLVVYCTSHTGVHDTLQKRILYDSSFQSNQYQEFELGYTIIPTTPAPPSQAQCLKGGVYSLNQYNGCRVDVRVWWYGNRTTWLDRVDIEDDVAYALFRRSNDGAIIQDAREFVGAYPNVKRFCSLDEPPLNAFRSYRYVDRLIMDSVNLGQSTTGRGRTITAFPRVDNEFKWFLNDAQPSEVLIAKGEYR